MNLNKQTNKINLLNHVKQIVNAKTRINNKSKIIKIKKADELIDYSNVKYTYKKLLFIKPEINSQNLNQVKKNNNKINYEYENREHLLRLNALGKRINYYGNIQDRKKKLSDPILNPVYFFRSPNDNVILKKINLNNYNQKIKDNIKEKKTPYSEKKSYKPKKLKSKINKIQPEIKQNIFEEKKNIEKIIQNFSIPKYNKEDIDFSIFENEIVKYIFLKRLYRDEDIENFKIELIKNNSNTIKENIECLIKKIISILDN